MKNENNEVFELSISKIKYGLSNTHSFNKRIFVHDINVWIRSYNLEVNHNYSLLHNSTQFHCFHTQMIYINQLIESLPPFHQKQSTIKQATNGTWTNNNHDYQNMYKVKIFLFLKSFNFITLNIKHMYLFKNLLR